MRRLRTDGEQVDLWFARKPMPAGTPILLFQHIRKTAGTAVRHLLAENLSGTVACYQYSPVVDTPEAPIGEWYRKYWDALTESERARLVCIASHTAGYAFGVLERPIRAFTVLRDPVDRLLSRYHFFKGERAWTLGGIFEIAGPDGKPEFFNGQARVLLQGHYDVRALATGLGPGPDANLWRARLFGLVGRSYSVGIQEYLDTSLVRLGAEFGWGVTVPTAEPRAVRINDRRPDRIVLSANEYAQIRAGNWLDLELYEHYSELARALDPPSKVSQAREGGGYLVEPAPEAGERDLEERVAALESRLQVSELIARIRLVALEERARAAERSFEFHIPRVRRPRRALPDDERGRALAQLAEDISVRPRPAPSQAPPEAGRERALGQLQDEIEVADEPRPATKPARPADSRGGAPKQLDEGATT